MYIKVVSLASAANSDNGAATTVVAAATQHFTLLNEFFTSFSLSQTEYNSVSFWGKLYLIELNVGLECIVKYCAFCGIFIHMYAISICDMHMSISLSVNDNNLHFLLNHVTHLLLILYVFHLIYSNKHSLNFIVDINNRWLCVYSKTSKSTPKHKHRCISIQNSRLFVWQSMNIKCHTCKHHFQLCTTNSIERRIFRFLVLLNPFCSLHWLLIATIIHT